MRHIIKVIIIALGLVMIIPFASVSASDISVYVDGSPVIFEDSRPIVADGITFVPLRAVFEKMGFDVRWVYETSTAIMYDGTTNVYVRPGRNFIETRRASPHRSAIHTNVSPKIVDGRIMLPYWLVAEATGARVQLIQDTNNIIITTIVYMPPITGWRLPTREEVVISQNSGMRYLRGQILVTPWHGVPFDELSEYLKKHGGEIIGVSDNFEVFQVYFHEWDLAELNNFIRRVVQPSAVLRSASLNWLIQIPCLTPYEFSEFMAQPPETAPLFELIQTGGFNGWIVPNLNHWDSPVALVFGSRAEIDDFIQRAPNEIISFLRQSNLAMFNEEFFQRYKLYVVAVTDRGNFPVTFFESVRTEEDVLIIDFRVTYPFGPVGSVNHREAYFIIAVDKSLYRSYLYLIF